MPDRDSAAERADAEALEWLMAVQESPDDGDVQHRFAQWLDASPLNAAAWAETAHAYAAIGETHPVHAERWHGIAAGRAQSPSRFGRGLPWARKRKTRPASRAKIILPAMAAAVAALLIGPDLALQLQADAVTAKGEVRQLTLADGSRAALSSQAAVKIDYSGRERRITLLQGQAWFHVVHDRDRPFRVVSGDVTTTDIGTAFEVVRSTSGVRVAVEEGAVQVEDKGAGRTLAGRLTSGQYVSVGSDRSFAHGTSPAALVAAWRDGQLAVEDRPMSEIVAALRSWHRGLILIRSDALARRHVTGVYDLRDPAGAMRALAKAYGGHVIQLTPWILVLSDD